MRIAKSLLKAAVVALTLTLGAGGLAPASHAASLELSAAAPPSAGAATTERTATSEPAAHTSTSEPAARTGSPTAAADAVSPTDAAGPAQAAATSGRAPSGDRPPPAGDDSAARPHRQAEPLPATELPPLAEPRKESRRDYDDPAATERTRPRPSARSAKAAACDVTDFTTRTGDALVAAIKAAQVSCVNTLFTLTGADARGAFRESQMITVADALRGAAPSYPGDNSTSVEQIVLYLRAGYYVQWYNEDAVGPYTESLQVPVRAGLDAFFAAPASRTVSDANGEVLTEAVILTASSGENARYIPVMKRLLDSYDSAHNASWWMRNAVYEAFNTIFRGHWRPDFVAAVAADNGLLHSLKAFAADHLDLLGTDSAFMTVNAGRELARFLTHPELVPTVKPMVKAMLVEYSMTGRTAPLWIGIADVTFDSVPADCAFYDVCDLPARLKAVALPLTHTCGPTLRILAQEMTAAQFATTCASLAGQDAFFHNLVDSGGRPVADDGNTTLEVVVFDSSADYRTYAGPIYGIDTNNGGMYLEGDPAAAGNQARFIAYEATWERPDFAVWNLNHEYTHYLDGRFDLYGNFGAPTTPVVWWNEGLAEYVSWSYRGLPNTTAYTEAGKHSHTLRDLFDTAYGQGENRIYVWGYLAVRYMFERQRAEVATLLGHYRTGNWSAAGAMLRSLDHETDWRTWLTACAAGACAEPPTLPDCTGADPRLMGEDCRRTGIGHTNQNYAYFYLWIPAGVTRLKVTSSGGTGNADLYVRRAGWATRTSHDAGSTGPGTSESLVADVTPNSWNYVSLYGVTDFSGVTLTTEY
ncbi:collagenase [Nonomuraea sp. bgisy101]|uniref:M9 family metallopeptidase n=1 Tax=Nonomuraea sp. bgisy101 TaxID=3413784 RepID=UPI003D74F7C0